MNKKKTLNKKKLSKTNKHLKMKTLTLKKHNKMMKILKK